MPLPHIQNSNAGRNYWDPVHNSLFEVYFTLPKALKDQFASDEALITEHVLSIDGLDKLEQGPETIQQKFMGTTRTYVAPKMGDTSFEIKVKFSLNLRNATDNFIYKIFKAWKNLNYNLATGEINLKKDYVADWLRVSIGNRAGDVYREVVFKDVMLKGSLAGSGVGTLDYTGTEAMELEVTFVSDWAQEVDA